MSIIKKLLIIATFILILFSIMGKSSYAAIYDAPPKLASDKPIKITSDKLKILRNKSIIVFDGNVIAIQGDLKLLSDKMIVYYVEGNKDASEYPNRISSVKRIDVEDNVKVIKGNLFASGDKGYYDIRAGILEVDGNVVMTEGGSEVQGNRFIYDVNSMESTIIGNLSNDKKEGDDGRVTIYLDEEVEKEVRNKDENKKENNKENNKEENI